MTDYELSEDEKESNRLCEKYNIPRKDLDFSIMLFRKSPLHWPDYLQPKAREMFPEYFGEADEDGK